LEFQVFMIKQVMEKFYHILIKQDGSIIHDTFATNHKDLELKWLSPKERQKKNYFKAYFSPKENHKLIDVNNYELINAEIYYPDWFTDLMREETIEKLKAIISGMIIRTRKPLLLHEGAILANGAVIDEVKHSIIFGMYEKAKIKTLDESSDVRDMTDETSIDVMRDGTRVLNMWGFAKIYNMKEYSKVMKMYGQAKIGVMEDHSRIVTLKGDASIKEMEGESHADRLKHMSSVEEMRGYSVIEEMWDWTVVKKMTEYARIEFMDDDAKVLSVEGKNIIECMCGNSVVERLSKDSLVRQLEDAAQILKKELED
jgi:hypothetical protein